MAIVKPKGAGTQYHNYMGFESIVLQAAADSSYEFIFAECGGEGSSLDAETLAATHFFKELTDDQLTLPPPEPVGDYPHALPYCFIGDEAYGLRSDFVQPYPQRNILPHHAIYNQLHGKAWRYVECSFNIMTKQFGVFRSPIGNLSLERVRAMVLALCILHNILRRNSPHYRKVKPDNGGLGAEWDLADQQPPEREGEETRQMHTDYANYLTTL